MTIILVLFFHLFLCIWLNHPHQNKIKKTKKKKNPMGKDYKIVPKRWINMEMGPDLFCTSAFLLGKEQGGASVKR